MELQTMVSQSKSFRKQLEKVPRNIQERVLYWIFVVERKGIAEIMKIPGHHDEPLKGNRFGQRSVRITRSYRIIYRVIEDRVHIDLLEVHKHAY